MDPSSVFKAARGGFWEIFVARKRLCQEFVLTRGIDLKSLSHIYQFVKRTDYTLFQVPESVRIDATASTIQYSADKISAFADHKNKAGGSMFCSISDAAR
jgi:hypothetical protein